MIFDSLFSKDIKTRFRLILWIMDKGYCHDTGDMEEEAARIGLDREELCRYCGEHFGTTFKTWRKDLRIKEAKRLIRRNPRMPISHVAEMVGIPDRSDFRKQFQEVTGIYPCEWAGEHCRGRKKRSADGRGRQPAEQDSANQEAIRR